MNCTSEKRNSIKTQETEYQQISMFDIDFFAPVKNEALIHTDIITLDIENVKETKNSKYTYIHPKQEKEVPHEYIVSVVKRGSGFEGGKERILEIFQTVMEKSERIKKIKKEYGQGGAGWPIEGLGLHGYDSFSTKGLRFQWKDEEGQKEGYVSWSSIENEISALIITGQYDIKTNLQKPPKLIESEVVEKRKKAPILKQPHPIKKKQQIDKPTYTLASTVFQYGLEEREVCGAKTRFKKNMDALRTLFEIEKGNRLATSEEQEILSSYVGWGGLAQAFNPKDSHWLNECLELRGLLSDAEYNAARSSVTSAFYTSPQIASCIHQALEQFGVHSGNILEPSMGIGVFLGTLPQSMKNVNFYGVELDSLSGRIAKKLYPEANIKVCGFEEITFPDNFFDAVIGNVPFGDYKLHDPKYNKHNLRIHEYFLMKSLDLVKPGGIIAFITSKGTLDKTNTSVRKLLASKAELIGAIRLPNTAFKDEAGTEVTSDILFLQKRENIMKSEPTWINLSMTEDGIPINSYFIENPEMMLGKMEYDNRIFGKNSNYTTCVNKELDFNLYQSLKKTVTKLATTSNTFIETQVEEEIEDTIPADPNVRNFTYSFVNGKLYFRENSKMNLINVSETMFQRIKKMDHIRQITRKLIVLQFNGCSKEELEKNQAELNFAYDKFVSSHGSITSKENARAFRDDADYPLLCSLEICNEDGTIKKAEMFSKQTIKTKVTIEKVETAVEALNVCINEYGKVDIAFMQSIYQKDISQEISELSPQLAANDEFIAELRSKVIIDELQGLIYLNPELATENDHNVGWETSEEYLSGNVREKLRLAQKKAQSEPETYSGNVTALTQVQPTDLDASQIEVRLGSNWIERNDYELFMYYIFDTPHYARINRASPCSLSGITITQNPQTMEWHIDGKSMDSHSTRATKTYGTERMNSYSILEDCLNLRTVTVRDRIDDGGGKYHYEVNKNETMLAREKQNTIKEAFRDWIFRNPERREKYVSYYNETFNNMRLRQYDGSHLVFPGMNPSISLKPHQKNAVARILHGKNTLLAHCVGAGKSFEMMAACMEQKRLGLANKTIMAVPKPLIKQTSTEFLRLYPAANILVTNERDFEKSRRQQFISRIAMGNYDCIIMSHSQFEKIKISKERMEKVINEKIEELSNAIVSIKNDSGERWTVKQIEAQRKKLEQQLKELNDDTKKDDLINFEELGVDSIMIDEAHNFKNLAIFSKINNVSGISSVGSKKASDMQMKCSYIDEVSNGRGIVFATGTPISNTMCELFVMQSYLQQDRMKAIGMQYFDSWAANFGEVTTTLELTVEGSGFRFKSRFNKFTNVPELMNLFKEIADIQVAEMLDLDVPKLKTGKCIISESEPDQYVKKVMESFVERAERIRNGGVNPSEDNFLKITHEAKLLGTDARLLDSQAPNNPDGKLNKVVENVLIEYNQAKNDGKIGCQLVFSDVGTPKEKWTTSWNGDKFDIYNYIKTELVARGIPEQEIAFIHDANTDLQRELLFKEIRSGKKKILIGSTDKCGTGVNVQTHLVAMHHVDCPWKPSSIEQREGRGIRQGNENSEIAVYRYVTKGTFDAYSWSLVENKQRFISQVMTSREISRTCEDIDEATLSYAEIKAIATGNPLIREKMGLDNEIQRLKVLKSSHNSQRYGLQDNFMVRFPKIISASKEKLICVKEDIREKNKQMLMNAEFSMKIGSKTFDERTDAGNGLMDAIHKCNTITTHSLGQYKGFEVLIEKTFMGINYLILQGKAKYKTEASSSPIGNIIKIENIFKAIDEQEAFLTQKVEQYERDLEQSKLEYEKPFVYELELQKLLKRQFELNMQLDLENGKIENCDLGGFSNEEVA